MASLGIALGVAPGMTALVMATTIATRWFAARRGLVLGILGAGNATGQLIFLMPAAWIARTYGWRMALVPPMLAIMVLALLAALLAVDRPADLSDLLRARAQNVCRLASGGANGPRDRSHELGRTIQSFGERLHGGAERVSRGRHHPALTSGRWKLPVPRSAPWRRQRSQACAATLAVSTAAAGCHPFSTGSTSFANSRIEASAFANGIPPNRNELFNSKSPSSSRRAS